MSSHVLARVSGFGWTILPYAPFACERLGEDVIVVSHETRRARIAFASGTPVIELGEGTESIHQVADIVRGPGWNHWRIETTVFTLRWPAGFALWSSGQAPGFDLLGPAQTMIYLQGPVLASRLPPLADMHAADQSVIAQGETWVELAYEHEGAEWRQRHQIAALGEYRLVLTGQGPEAEFPFVRSALEEVTASVQPAPEQE